VKLIVDREAEILGFVPVEYWSIEAELAKEDKRSPSFRAG
jgi:DNA topoisomerase IA